MGTESLVDFVIVTALEEEREAVLLKLPGYKRLPPAADTVNVYYAADVPITFPGGSTAKYRIIVLSLLSMGRVQATIAASEAIRRWRPNYVLLIGIAGGVSAKGVSLGDVLVSSQVVDYELQKITAQGPQVRWEVHRVDPRLQAAVRNFDDNSWQALISVHRPEAGQIRRHIGPIASGDKVIAFSEVLSFYRDKWPTLLGVEMEAGGAAAATFQAAESPGFFMVRSVSDLADEAKGTPDVDRWRAYACDVAASYSIALLKSGPVIPREPQTTSDSRTADPRFSASVPDTVPYAPSMIRIPAGPFWLGSPPDDYDAPDNTKPGREIYLPEFAIGGYPITNAQYASFVSDSRHAVPKHWANGQIPSGFEDHPAVNVNFDDAIAYCGWLSELTKQSYRLPTEAEWEKAARGPLPNKYRYVWGNEWRTDASNTQELGRDQTTSIHEFEQTNRSVLGVIDLAGNVWEWTASWYESYPGSERESLSYGQTYRVVRGSSYHNPSQDARISTRGRYKPETRRPYLGFRVVLETLLATREGSPRREIQSLDVVTLRLRLTEYFSLGELRDLCFDLKIDYENLPHSSKSELARELVIYCQRHDRLSELSNIAQRLRLDIPW